MLLTFFLTVLVDLTVAVYVGVLLASLLFMRRMSVMSSIEALDEHDVVHDYDESLINQEDLPKGVFVYSIFFGMVDRFQRMFMRRNPDIKVYILYMRDVPAIDATGIHVLEAFLSHRHSHDFHVILANPPARTRRILKKMGIMDALGENNICHSLKAAIIRAEHLL
jgi:SulP family sulfate permease